MIGGRIALPGCRLGPVERVVVRPIATVLRAMVGGQFVVAKPGMDLRQRVVRGEVLRILGERLAVAGRGRFEPRCLVIR